MSIRQVVNESDTFSGRAFDFVVLFLIVFSIITLTIDTLPDLPSFVSDVLDISEIVITVLFTIEYLVRVAAAPKKIGYILSFYGIVDLIAILPFYIALGVDLRAVRAFRLFRIIRILKLTRYSRAMERFAKALRMQKKKWLYFGSIADCLERQEVGLWTSFPGVDFGGARADARAAARGARGTVGPERGRGIEGSDRAWCGRGSALSALRERGGGFARYGAGSAALPVQGLRQDLQRADRHVRCRACTTRNAGCRSGRRWRRGRR